MEPLVKLTFTSDFLESQVEECLGNLKSSLGRGLPSIKEVTAPHDGTMLIVGTGPTLAAQIETLRQASGFILAVNEAHDYLIDNGIIPHGWIFTEVSPWEKNLVRNEAPGCRYYVASQCAPSTFDYLQGRDIMLWHAWQDIGEGPLITEAELCDAKLIGGGCTPSLRAICLGMVLGYRKFETFGVDGCYDTNSHVAYEAERTDWGAEAHLDVVCVGRKFKTVGYLARQAHDFIEFLKRHGHGFTMKMHGDGLMQHIHRIHLLNRRFSVC